MDEFAPRRPTRRPRARSTLELSLPALPHCSHRRPEPEPEPEPRRTQVRSSHPTTIPSQCSRSAAIKRPGIAPTSRPPHPSTDQPRIDVAGRSDMAFQGVRGPVVENSLETRSTRRPNHRAATLKPAAQLAWMAVALAMLMLMLLAFAESSGVRAAAVQSDDHSSQNRAAAAAAAAGIQPRDSSDSSVVDNDADVDTARVDVAAARARRLAFAADALVQRRKSQPRVQHLHPHHQRVLGDDHDDDNEEEHEAHHHHEHVHHHDSSEKRNNDRHETQTETTSSSAGTSRNGNDDNNNNSNPHKSNVKNDIETAEELASLSDEEFAERLQLANPLNGKDDPNYRMFKHHHISPEEIERLKAEGISPGQHTAEQVHEDELDELQFGDRHFGGQAHTHVDRHGKLYAAKFDELGREIDEDGNLMTVMDIIERRLHHSQFEGREPPEGLFKRWDIENKEPPILYYQEKHWEGLEPPWAEEERELAIFMNAECEVTELREAYHAACYRHGHLIPCTTVCMMAFHRYYDRLIEPKCLKGTIHHTPTSEHLRWLLLAHDAEIAHHCPDKYRVMDVREMHALHMMIDKSQPDNPELGLDDTAHAGHLHMQKNPTSAERKGIDVDLPGHGFNVKLDVVKRDDL